MAGHVARVLPVLQHVLTAKLHDAGSADAFSELRLINMTICRHLQLLLLSAAALCLVGPVDSLSDACSLDSSCYTYQSSCAAASGCSYSYITDESSEPGVDGCVDVCCFVCHSLEKCSQFCATFSSDGARPVAHFVCV